MIATFVAPDAIVVRIRHRREVYEDSTLPAEKRLWGRRSAGEIREETTLRLGAAGEFEHRSGRESRIPL